MKHTKGIGLYMKGSTSYLLTFQTFGFIKLPSISARMSINARMPR